MRLFFILVVLFTAAFLHSLKPRLFLDLDRHLPAHFVKDGKHGDSKHKPIHYMS